MERPYETHAVVEEGGRLTLTDLPFPAGQSVDLQVAPHQEASDVRSIERDPLAVLLDLAAWTEAKYPNAPLLSNEAISRDSIYEDRGL